MNEEIRKFWELAYHNPVLEDKKLGYYYVQLNPWKFSVLAMTVDCAHAFALRGWRKIDPIKFENSLIYLYRIGNDKRENVYNEKDMLRIINKLKAFL